MNADDLSVRGLLLGLLILNLHGQTQPEILPQPQAKRPSPVLYVSTRGNDVWSGALPEPNSAGTDGPFATLDHARDEVRRIPSRGALTAPVTVYLRGGVYTLHTPLIFTPADSGAPLSRTIYKAYPNETPVISGGRAIGGWRRVSALSDLPRGGLGAPPLQDDLWVAAVPGVSQGAGYFRDLFVNGKRRQRARIPNQGFYLAEGPISRENPARLRFHPGDIDPSWAGVGGAEVGALLAWGGFHLQLRAVDPATRTATLSARRQPWGNEENPRYWIENIPQALDAPGEWYLDRLHGALYYHATPDDNMSQTLAIAPVLRQLIRFEGDPEAESLQALVHDLSLEGLTFTDTDSSASTTGWTQTFVEWSSPADGHIDEQAAVDIPAAVEGLGSQSCMITKCAFTRLGGYAVQFHGGSKDNVVSRNLMADLGAGGVKIGDPKSPSFDAQATSGNIVSDNTIHDIGLVYATGIGVWVGESSRNSIAHNEIYDTPYSGISVGWTWGYGPTWARENIIEYNHIYNIGRGILSDLGCIYLVGVQPGTIARNNLCHDVKRYAQGYGGWGIYTDEGAGSMLIENNVVYRTQDGGFHQNFGRENVLRNNIFALGELAQLRRTHNEKHLTLTFDRNIFYWQDGKLLEAKWDDGNYKFDSNLYFRAGGGTIDFAGKSFEEWQKTGQDVHSLTADPLFVDAAHGNFSLQPGSPAFKIGFKPIDVSGVGPRTAN